MTTSSPYRGLAPFEDSELDALFFFGREHDSEIVVANLIASRFTVLYGPSGVGKSSLLLASVARKLRELPEQPLVVVFSSWTEDPESGLAAAVGGDNSTLLEVVERAQAERDVYLILDQAEEYFVYHGEDTAFEEALAGLVTRPLRVNVLLSLREDTLARLDRLKALIPNLFGNVLRLDRLDRASGRAAIVRPLERWSELHAEAVTAEGSLVDDVLDGVGAGRIELGPPGGQAAVEQNGDAGIEAPYLQLVMQRLWDVERASGSTTLRAATLADLGGARQVVADHLERAIDALTPPQQALAAVLFDHLVTPSGTKIAHEASDLAQFTGAPETEVRPVLASLVEYRILRTDEGGRYEIFHDVLAGAVLGWTSRFHAEQALTQERSRRRRAVAVAAVALAAVGLMAAVTVYALNQRGTARTQARLARVQEGRAQEQARVARAQARIARGNELAAKAVSQLSSNPQQSLALALRSVRSARTNETERVLREALVSSRLRLVLPARGGTGAKASFSNDGLRVLTTGGDGKARVFSARTGELLRTLRHRGRVTDATFSRDDRLIATAAADGSGRLWRTTDGALLHVLGHRAPVRSISLSSDGRVAATGSDDSTARVWRVADGSLVRVLDHDAPVRAVTLSPDGTRLATVTRDGVVTVFSVADGGLLYQLRTPAGLTGAVFSPDGRLLVVLGLDGKAEIRDGRTGSLHHVLAGHRAAVLSAAFSRRGSLLVTTGADDVAFVWNVARGLQVARLFGHSNLVRDAAFSPNGRFIATASSDRSVRVWETAGGRSRVVLNGHTEPVTSVAFNSSGDRVVTASEDGTAAVWDPGTASDLAVVGHHPRPISSAAFSPDGKFVVTASTDGTARIWRSDDRALVAILRHRAPVASAVFSPDGKVVVTSSADRTAAIWNVRSGRLEHRLSGHRDALTGASFSPDGTRVLTLSHDRTARVWATGTGALLHVLRGHTASVTGSAVSPDGLRAVTISSDGTARIWDIRTGRLLRTLRGHRAPLTDVSWSEDGARIATAGGDRTARLWNAVTGRALHTLRGHRDVVTSVSFSTDSGLVVTTSRDHDARLWSVATGKRLHVVRHFGPISDASFSPDGKWLVTAGPTTAGVWHTETGRLLFFLSGPQARLTSAVFSPDGSRILVASLDGTARIYRCLVCGSVDEVLRLAERRLARLSRR
jgi:WD40 repeat protein